MYLCGFMWMFFLKNPVCSYILLYIYSYTVIFTIVHMYFSVYIYINMHYMHMTCIFMCARLIWHDSLCQLNGPNLPETCSH